MSIRKKTLIIFGLIIIGLIAILILASRAILLKSFSELDRQELTVNVQRTLDLISDDLAKMKGNVLEWAAWDETCAFIESGNGSYIRSNLRTNAFSSLDLNMMLFINSSGRIVWGSGFDLTRSEMRPLPGSLVKDLVPGNALLKNMDPQKSVKGIKLLSEGPMLLVSHPILSSEQKGPAKGTMIIGRYLNDAVIRRLSDVTHLPIHVHRLDSPDMPADLKSRLTDSSRSAPILTSILSRESMEGYALLSDIEGNPAVALTVGSSRKVYNQGLSTISYFMFWFIGIGVVFAAGGLLTIERLVLSRLTDFTRHVSQIGSSRDPGHRLPAEGRDELSGLGFAINFMLESLEQYRHHLENLVEELQQEVNERRKAEEQLQASVKEKEVLLREIHHRVKNNMQVISSMLNLQATRLKDEPVREMFRQCQQRIRSMALIHERLYQSTDYSHINFAQYLSSLVTHLFQSYRTEEERIRLNLDVEDAFLNIDTAIPLGLISNEIISNALKHAFPGEREGEIRLSFHRRDDDNYELRIKDNGVGMPAEVKPGESTSLGMKIVSTLVDQIEGRSEFLRNGGTEFRLTFKVQTPPAGQPPQA